MGITAPTQPPPLPSSSKSSSAQTKGMGGNSRSLSSGNGNGESSRWNGTRATSNISPSAERGGGEEQDMEIDEGDQSDDVDSGSEEEGEPEREVVNVEVRMLPTAMCLPGTLKQLVNGYMDDDVSSIALGRELGGWKEIPILRQNIERIWVEELESGLSYVDYDDVDIAVHVYQPASNEDLNEFKDDLDEDEQEQNSVSTASIRTLPSAELDGIWSNLIYADNLKGRLLDYIYSTLVFSDSDIDFNVIAWNRVILLHGPPGTGKTSLCRALAQKIAIRLSPQYSTGKLVEINSHSLFSKWFSESGKLVHKLFQNVTELVDNPDCFVTVMIDEVESLTAARAKAVTGNEPSDSLRVVNALLTQLDKLRTKKNVLVMTTSNIIDAIDEAFLSRVDMLEFVPLPPPQAVYGILVGCVAAMMDGGLVKPFTILSWSVANRGQEGHESRRQSIARELVRLAEKCHSLQMSGRTLRKLPVLAHTAYLQPSSTHRRLLGGDGQKAIKVERWLHAMNRYVDTRIVPGEAQAQDGPSATATTASGTIQPSVNVNVNGGPPGHARTASQVEREQVGTYVGSKVVNGHEHGEGHGHANGKGNGQ